MFGYVKVHKDEMLVKEYEAYRGMYCSLCKALGKRYGLLSRMILSYDMTFLVILRLAQADLSPRFHPGRCPFNPTKRCNYCTNAEEQMEFTCAAAILMFYYKVRDNIQDVPFGKRLLFLLLLPYAAWKRRKAMRNFAWMDAILSEAMAQQRQLEQEGTASFDAAAHPSAHALGTIAAYGTGEREAAFYRFGYFVGRWVYLMDAADDLKKDLKSKNFNVFVTAFHLTEETLTDAQKETVFATLNSSCACAADALQQCNVTVFHSILENIIYEGTAAVMDCLGKGKRSHERSL